MPKITSIKSQKNRRRVNIYLDDEFGFGVDLESFMKLKLKVGQELSEKKIKETVEEAEYAKQLNNLLRFASLRPRSEKEIRGWVKRKKVHRSIHKKLFDKLRRLDLMDDEKFARWWVEQRMSFRPRAKRILDYELRMKGVSKEIIKRVLEGNVIDEAKIARELTRKNEYRWERFDEKTRKKKMGEYLMRKGFGWEVVEKVVRGK